ncbi:MAG: lamin tail domain-containing protein [Clostridia bacterium]|nr:lamin tail domain-containing protein [Clostridia bacterium]
MKKMLMFMLALLTLTGTACAEEAETLTLFAVNVGKGDALLLNAGEHTYLIDTGKAEHWGDLSRALKTMQIDHLTGVIFTHTDKDHVGGAMALATSPVRVDGWYASAYYADVKESKHPVATAAALCGKKVAWLKAGDSLPLGDGLLRVVGPMSESKTENCNSLVMIAEGGGGRMLLAGDMEHEEEYELLNAGVIPKCEVLKVGNHGEGDATSEALIRYVQPRIAVISTSTQEEPDTPDARVLRNLFAVRADVYETQKAESGVLVTLTGGQAEARLMNYKALPALPENIRLTDREPEEDHIRIRNYGGEAVDLSGWYILSERGGEMFVLPAGTWVQPGEVVVISTLSSGQTGDVVWPQKKVWHKSKDDAAMLYDVYGRLVDTLE